MLRGVTGCYGVLRGARWRCRRGRCRRPAWTRWPPAPPPPRPGQPPSAEERPHTKARRSGSHRHQYSQQPGGQPSAEATDANRKSLTCRDPTQIPKYSPLTNEKPLTENRRGGRFSSSSSNDRQSRAAVLKYRIKLLRAKMKPSLDLPRSWRSFDH
eukprot:1184458-Prorocentrum_minimum.AAC.2